MAVAGLGALAVVLAMCTGVVPGLERVVNEKVASTIPAPVLDEPPQAAGTSETVVLAGGCFWGVQGVYQHVKGVTEALSGYAGGDAETAKYETVGTGTTGHAESVRITFDPSQVTFGQLLQIFFGVVHDPTELDRQGPDTGTQYRSAIFVQNETQQRVADAYITQLTDAKVFSGPIVTRIEPNASFFPAERYHQDYLNSNPWNPYIVVNDIPKVKALRAYFPGLYREEPVLVA
ncbi:MAG: peptide-methionine (S)-S-oxide reductase MsrA [Nocardiaceae bacterium]|nr:peptide-methionine (S)-S-oxide reductase MsrA [Nocardiaceae bacterium]